MAVRFKNLSQFNRELKDFGVKVVPERALALQKRIALDLLSRIVFRTPVDTGRARGNWQTALGESSGTAIEAFDKAGTATISAGASIVNAAKPFGVISLFNNVDYINSLEGGSSKRFPEGMVRVSLAEVEAQF